MTLRNPLHTSYSFCHNAAPNGAGEFRILGVPECAETWSDDEEGAVHFLANREGVVRQTHGNKFELTSAELHGLLWEVRMCFPEVTSIHLHR